MYPQELVDQFEQRDEKVKKLELKVAKLELEADKVEQYSRQSNLKPATGWPYLLAFVDSGTVPAFTPIVWVFTRWRKVDPCVPASSETMLAFEKTPVVHVLLLRPVAGVSDISVNRIYPKATFGEMAI